MKCIEDEIPFDLPDGWAWTRLGNLSAAIQYGLSNSAKQQGTHRLLRITDIQDGKVNWDTVPFTTVDDPETYLLKTGDIVFARTGATVGKSFLITEIPYPSVYASYLIRIRLLGNLLPEYIYQFFDSACYWSQITDKSVGVGQPNCNGTSLKELLIPLPPINEQLRIVPTAQALLAYVAKIDAEKKSLLSIGIVKLPLQRNCRKCGILLDSSIPCWEQTSQIFVRVDIFHQLPKRIKAFRAFQLVVTIVEFPILLIHIVIRSKISVDDWL